MYETIVDQNAPVTRVVINRKVVMLKCVTLMVIQISRNMFRKGKELSTFRI